MSKKNFFWHDTRLHNTPLDNVFPSLYSHSTNTHILVSHIMHYGLLVSLVNWLATDALNEFVALSLLLQDFQLSNGMNERYLLYGPIFSSKVAYGIIMHEDEEDDHVDLIWCSRSPNKIQIFAWLLFRGRINMRANFFRKYLALDAHCLRCPCTSEDTLHLFISCPTTTRIWLHGA